MSDISIAGKVFILGEYAVLAGLPALVTTVSPRFTLQLRREASTPVPALSPLGKLQEWAQTHDFSPLEFHFQDPYEGRGGFGASTAQFAMAYFAYRKNQGDEVNSIPEWDAWGLYRELMQTEGLIPPSGADLVAQWRGGVTLFDPTRKVCEDLGGLLTEGELLVFSATSQSGRKVPTHEHLQKLSSEDFPGTHSRCIQSLREWTELGVSAFRRNDLRQLGHAMNHYAETLAQEGWEVEATREDRLVLGKLPGVLGVKGTGALQSDAILVLLSAGAAEKEQVLKLAQARGLHFIADGLKGQKGIQCHKE